MRVCVTAANADAKTVIVCTIERAYFKCVYLYIDHLFCDRRCRRRRRGRQLEYKHVVVLICSHISHLRVLC